MNLKYLAVLFLAMASCVLDAQARTWRVELDGSGDFVDIQPAVDAAAPGDTIRIGPGRFDTFHPITAPAWTEDAIVGVLKDNLTFVGSGQDVTILGPSSYRGFPGENPKVLCSFGGYSARVENITIENVEAGIYWHDGVLLIAGCAFRASSPNFFALQLATSECTVQACDFDLLDGGTAVLIGSSTGDVRNCRIIDCDIQGANYGIRVGYGAGGVLVRNTTIFGAYWGIGFDQGSVGQIENCVISGSQDRSMLIASGSQVVAIDSEFSGGSYGISVSGGSSFDGSGIVVESTTEAALYFYSDGQAIIHESHILPVSGWAFDCFSYNSMPVTIDLTGNYWGTADSGAIAAMIHDSHDDPSLHCTVAFEPFASGPVPTESTSWGDLKALFR